MRQIVRFATFFTVAMVVAIVTGWDAAGVMACIALAVACQDRPDT